MSSVKWLLLVLLGLVVVTIVSVWLVLRGSLPLLDGDLVLEGITAPVEITRDPIGVVTIHAGNRRDAAFATGFVHAQERIFQMDLMRRLAAGELSALVGAGAADHDAAQRIHRMRAVARQVIAQADDAARELVDAYAAGVDAGVAALPVRPFEYLILREQPAAWRSEDTVLVVLAMYFRLHDERATRETGLGRLHAALPPPMFDFVTQSGTPWDAPLAGDPAASLPVPGPEVCDVRRAERGSIAGPPWSASAAIGSNAWAIAPARTRDGVAILANDMHLGLSLPNTWFRLRLRVAGAGPEGGELDVTGVTLPGTPAIVAGSNTRVAWGLTNTYGDWVDLVDLELDPDAPNRYRTSEGYRPFDVHEEVVAIRGAEPRTVIVKETVWGPLLPTAAGDPPRALRWMAHEAEATDLGLLAMERVRTVEEALAVARTSGIPPQNLVVVDRWGNIGWTIMGRMPRRRDYDPRLPTSWSDGDRGWHGWVAAEDYPAIINPVSAAIWTANTRVAEGEALRRIGDGGYALGARAAQIRDGLLALEDATVADMLTIQLDDRALFLAPWRQLLLDLLDAQALAGAPRRAEMRGIVEAGARRASAGDAGYRLVREFRREALRRVFAAIATGCGGLEPEGPPPGLRQWEGALWRVVQERPAHLLAPGYESWEAFLLEAADEAAAGCGDGDLVRCVWGKRNSVHIRHPLSRPLPLLSRWIDLEPVALPGDLHMPRVQTPSQGASQRFAVTPGREADGYFHMPGGQSGHPMSPYYDAGHAAWVEGRPLPFLPGPERHRLVLSPSP